MILRVRPCLAWLLLLTLVLAAPRAGAAMCASALASRDAAPVAAQSPTGRADDERGGSGGEDDVRVDAEAGPIGLLLEAVERGLPGLVGSPEEALVIADVARRLGRVQLAAALLERASASEALGQVAAVELARIELEHSPARAVERVLEMLRHADTPQIRQAAIEVATAALDGGLPSEIRARLEAESRRMPRRLARPLELGLVLAELRSPGSDEAAEMLSGARASRTDPASALPGLRKRLRGLLEAEAGDLEALAAARTLAAIEPIEPIGPTESAESSGAAGTLSPADAWLVARTLFRHALYTEAEPLLAAVEATRPDEAPAWEIAFLRGRCAFRRGRWDEAASLYREALGRTRDRERRARLETHLGRTLELDGDLAGAIEAARRAVIIRSSDDRRLFLARLRLRNDQLELAERGVRAVRHRVNRDRGTILLALGDLGAGRPHQALARLQEVRSRQWTGSAGVLAATVAADEGDWLRVEELLYKVGPELDPFWAMRARRLVANMPEDRQGDLWRTAVDELSAAIRGGRGASRILARWSALSLDDARLAAMVELMRQRLGPEPGSDREGPAGQEPRFSGPVADELWGLGLQRAAVRWDPGGFPGATATEAAWSAARFLEQGVPTRAMSSAHAAWQMAVAPALPRTLPAPLRRALFPLPDPALVERAAAIGHMPWDLLAGMVREESRWDPAVISRVGARGLTQLMPATAAGIAAGLGEAEPEPDRLFEPEVGLRLGAVELGRLLARFNGLQVAAVAAYNAGEAQALEWLDQCPAPCTEDRYLLTISFDVTRGYTADVLASADAYSVLYPQIERHPEIKRRPEPEVEPPGGGPPTRPDKGS